MPFTRDSAGWWLAIAGMLLAYFAAADQTPMQWTWHQWTQFGIAVVTYLTGKLQTSPLPSKDEKAAKEAGV